MSEEPVELYLKKLEKWRINQNLSRADAAKELGIPRGTYANWYRKGKSKTKPSGRYVQWLKSFLTTRGILSGEKFLEHEGPETLRRIGFEKELTVMDFGCGNGDYSLMISRAVGPNGQVFAIDKNKDVLYEMMGRARGEKLDNIKMLHLSDSESDPPTEIDLPTGSINAGWFADVLHDGYFEEDELKGELIKDVRRVLSPDGFLAFHPIHMDKKRLKKIIEDRGFRAEKNQKHELLFHGSEFHRGTVLKFKKADG
ncbi:MAG: methyltransferase domain-containing protein [Planctomycetes bacterium]|nr:methyltransferase domain-containing protein [Planctomycetota bacterium]